MLCRHLADEARSFCYTVASLRASSVIGLHVWSATHMALCRAMRRDGPETQRLTLHIDVTCHSLLAPVPSIQRKLVTSTAQGTLTYPSPLVHIS